MDAERKYHQRHYKKSAYFATDDDFFRIEFIIDSMLTGFAVFVRSGVLFIFVPVVVHVAL